MCRWIGYGFRKGGFKIVIREMKRDNKNQRIFPFNHRQDIKIIEDKKRIRHSKFYLWYSSNTVVNTSNSESGVPELKPPPSRCFLRQTALLDHFVDCFFVRSSRYSASYHQWRASWFSNVPRGRASGIIALRGGGEKLSAKRFHCIYLTLFLCLYKSFWTGFESDQRRLTLLVIKCVWLSGAS